MIKLPTGKRIIKNILSLSFANIISYILAFITTAYLARILGANRFGQIGVVQAIILYFNLLSDVGLKQLGIRIVARNPNKIKKYVNNIISMKICLSILSFSLLLVLFLFVNNIFEYKILIIFFGISIFPNALLLDWVFQGIECMEYLAFANICRSLIYLILVFLFIDNASDILKVPIFFLISLFFPVLFLFYIFINNYGWFNLAININFWKKALVQAIPMGFSIIMIQIYYNIDIIMLGFIKGAEVAGWYSAAYKIILALLSLGGLISFVTFPIISRYYKESRKKLFILLNNLAKVRITLVIPLCIGGIIISDSIIKLIYGEGYKNGIFALKILMCTVAVILINANFGSSLLACNGEKKYAMGVSIGAILNIILNLLLIPSFSLNGAAVATLITEIMVLLYMLYQFNKIIYIPIIHYFLKPIIAASIMGIALLTMQNNLFIKITIGIMIYFLILILIKGINKNDIRLMKKIIFNM